MLQNILQPRKICRCSANINYNITVLYGFSTHYVFELKARTRQKNRQTGKTRNAAYYNRTVAHQQNTKHLRNIFATVLFYYTWDHNLKRTRDVDCKVDSGKSTSEMTTNPTGACSHPLMFSALLYPPSHFHTLV